MKKIKVYAILIIILAIVCILVYRREIVKLFYPRNYSSIVSEVSQKYKVENDLIYAVIKAESNFNKDAKSNKGAVGLMQIMEETALEIAPDAEIKLTKENVEAQLLNPEINIKLGTMYLQSLLEKYENIEVALTAYNAGVGNVEKWIEQGIIKKDGSNIEAVPFKETNNYVRKILRDYNMYKKIS